MRNILRPMAHSRCVKCGRRVYAYLRREEQTPQKRAEAVCRKCDPTSKWNRVKGDTQ